MSIHARDEPGRHRPTPLVGLPGALVAGLLGVLLSSGCVADEPDVADRATEPTAAPSAEPSAEPSALSTPASPSELSWELAAILSGSATGGQVSTTAVRLDDAEAARDFGAQFTRPPLAQDLEQAVAAADVPAGSALYAAVIAVGCDVPPDVRVDTSAGPEGIVVTGTKATTRPVQCLVPVTSVALIAVAGAVG